jgi:hypothetical protein
MVTFCPAVIVAGSTLKIQDYRSRLARRRVHRHVQHLLDNLVRERIIVSL